MNQTSKVNILDFKLQNRIGFPANYLYYKCRARGIFRSSADQCRDYEWYDTDYFQEYEESRTAGLTLM